MTSALDFIVLGGPAIWAISALSVVTLALILWKAWALARAGAWSGGAATETALAAWAQGDETGADAALTGRQSIRAGLVRTALSAARSLPEPTAREETTRIGRRLLTEARSGLRALELIATIAPLLGLLGTVLGMIAAFQALEATGNRADPSVLAGGIWEALLTTAAGMAVAIPAAMALTWFEGVIARLEADMEDAATRVFTSRNRESSA